MRRMSTATAAPTANRWKRIWTKKKKRKKNPLWQRKTTRFPCRRPVREPAPVAPAGGGGERASEEEGAGQEKAAKKAPQEEGGKEAGEESRQETGPEKSGEEESREEASQESGKEKSCPQERPPLAARASSPSDGGSPALPASAIALTFRSALRRARWLPLRFPAASLEKPGP